MAGKDARAPRSSFNASPGVDERDDQLGLGLLVRERGEVVVPAVAAELDLEVEGAEVLAPEQHPEGAAGDLVGLNLLDEAVLRLEGVAAVVGPEGDVRPVDEERPRAGLFE